MGRLAECVFCAAHRLRTTPPELRTTESFGEGRSRQEGREEGRCLREKTTPYAFT